jgi:hypothetical protein
MTADGVEIKRDSVIWTRCHIADVPAEHPSGFYEQFRGDFDICGRSVNGPHRKDLSEVQDLVFLPVTYRWDDDRPSIAVNNGHKLFLEKNERNIWLIESSHGFSIQADYFFSSAEESIKAIARDIEQESHNLIAYLQDATSRIDGEVAAAVFYVLRNQFKEE